MIKTIEEASKELAGHWLPAPELMPHGWPENIEAVTDDFRLGIFRTLSVGQFKTDLLRLVSDGKITARSATGSYLSPHNEPAESTLVDVVEAKTAFEAEGMKFQYAESAASSGAQESAELRKRAVFITEVNSFWLSIEQDLSDSSRNGLHKAAKHQSHGFWSVEPAIKWATERGKISKGKAQSFVASNEESYLSPMLRFLLKLD